MRMGSGGPCDHCGRTSSPCWRKGPAEKPLLCNACGARYLVKRNLDGYLPGAKPSARTETTISSSKRRNTAILMGQTGATSVQSKPGEGKRKRKAVKRFADDNLSLLESDFDELDHPHFYGERSDSPVRRATIIRRHRNGKTTIDRGTQTVNIGRMMTSDDYSQGFPTTKRSKVYTLHANAQLKINEEEFNQIAVSTLALLSRPPPLKSEPVPPLFVARRRRKPEKPTVRTLF